jgi:hypothetical protein
MRWNTRITVVLTLAFVFTVGCAPTENLERDSTAPEECKDPDQRVLDQLRRAGSDLSKPHDVDFFLYFPSQVAAETARDRMTANGFVVVIGPNDDGSWTCQGTKTMVPMHAAIVGAGRFLNDLAVELSGDYDGWGAAVVE